MSLCCYSTRYRSETRAPVGLIFSCNVPLSLKTASQSWPWDFWTGWCHAVESINWSWSFKRQQRSIFWRSCHILLLTRMQSFARHSVQEGLHRFLGNQQCPIRVDPWTVMGSCLRHGTVLGRSAIRQWVTTSTRSIIRIFIIGSIISHECLIIRWTHEWSKKGSDSLLISRHHCILDLDAYTVSHGLEGIWKNAACLTPWMVWGTRSRSYYGWIVLWSNSLFKVRMTTFNAKTYHSLCLFLVCFFFHCDCYLILADCLSFVEDASVLDVECEPNRCGTQQLLQ